MVAPDVAGHNLPPPTDRDLVNPLVRQVRDPLMTSVAHVAPMPRMGLVSDLSIPEAGTTRQGAPILIGTQPQAAAPSAPPVRSGRRCASVRNSPGCRHRAVTPADGTA